MNNLPKKFPEYSIMYKTLSNRIALLEKRIEDAKEQDADEINAQIQNYRLELNRIRSMFPDEFFEESD
ncbi:MAG: hypothetical protein KC444_09425 [Nitrosopumilus sp.]|nr:hypothetical protein [Nitrosopumilus sp.]